MKPPNPFSQRKQKVSESPTAPHRTGRSDEAFDVADLYRGPLGDGAVADKAGPPLDEKLRQAYFWIVNQAIISPYYDVEYEDGPSPTFVFGDSKASVRLPSGQSYSSFVLLPLLNLAVRRRCLLVGGPGRGKTATALLMGVLSGYPLKEVKRAVQHGQPQMTITDLLGNPLPKDLVGADSMDDIRIAWRRWLSMRVKIIDEYNRIPTRTQSALLTVMADNYAEVLDHVYECPDAAWYLTANDDAGGGTYQVIEALRDRIDVVVKALHFSPRFLNELLLRIESGLKPEEVVPSDIIFTPDELDRMYQEILQVRVDPALRQRMEFFASQFEFCEPAAGQFEYRTKDTLKLSGLDFVQITAQQTGTDRRKDLGLQTQNGLSVRALMTSLIFFKAMAYMRGDDEVRLEDMRQMMPFVLHDKLVPNHNAPFFDEAAHQHLRVDRISWIRTLFDLACAEFDRLGLDQDDPARRLQAEFDEGLDGLDERTVKKRLGDIERVLRDWSGGRKLHGHLYDDILQLKYLHQRYTNYLRWVKWKR